MNNLEKEALKYDLEALKRLQLKRQDNIILFENSIRIERQAAQQEEMAQINLETKLRNHDLGLVKLNDVDKEWILSDLPKLKSAQIKRNQTIMLLKSAILEEQETMDREEKMIRFLEKNNDSKK